MTLRSPHLPLLLLAALGLGACEEDQPLLRTPTPKTTPSGDYFTTVRGVAGLREGHEPTGDRSAAGTRGARVILQPLEVRQTGPRYVNALYLNERDLVATLRQALREASIAPYRTCEPTWRLDLREGSQEHVALINVPCQRLVLDGRPLAYSGEVARVIDPLLTRTLRRPTHRVLRVKVPVEHDPAAVVAALTPHALEVFLPDQPPSRGPEAHLSLNVLTTPPADPGQLDRAVEALRRGAFDRLTAYLRDLRVQRPDVEATRGPSIVFERFSDRRFEARYAAEVRFRHGTPEHQLSFLGVSRTAQLEKIVHPVAYRVDAVFAETVPYAKMRTMLEGLSLEPALAPW
jgi:hypothetical protein